MNEYGFGQLSFSERVAIETGICKGETFRQIAKMKGSIVICKRTI